MTGVFTRHTLIFCLLSCLSPFLYYGNRLKFLWTFPDVTFTSSSIHDKGRGDFTTATWKGRCGLSTSWLHNLLILSDSKSVQEPYVVIPHLLYAFFSFHTFRIPTPLAWHPFIKIESSQESKLKLILHSVNIRLPEYISAVYQELLVCTFLVMWRMNASFFLFVKIKYDKWQD